MRSNRQRASFFPVKRTASYTYELTGTDSASAMAFSAQAGLGDTLWAAISPLYDEYKLCLVKTRWTYMSDFPVHDTEVPGSVLPTLGVCEDTNSIETPIGLKTIEQHQRYKIKTLKPGGVLSFSIKPKLQKMAYLGVATTAYMPGFGWCRTANGDVPHYGMKWYFETQGAGTGASYSGQVRRDMTFYVMFRKRKLDYAT